MIGCNTGGYQRRVPVLNQQVPSAPSTHILAEKLLESQLLQYTDLPQYGIAHAQNLFKALHYMQ